MEIEVVHTIECVKLELSIDEAERFVVDPKHVQKMIRASLLEMGLDVPNGRGGGKAAKPTYHKRRGSKMGGHQFPKVDCPECHKPFASNVIDRHRRTKHGATA